MYGHRSWVLVLALMMSPLCAHSMPITYGFQALGTYTDTVGLPPPVPAGLAGASSWVVQGTIVVDNEVAAVYDDPYIRLDQQIVGGSLSINGLSAGAFDDATFRYYFMDGFAESSRPYDAWFELSFAAGDDFGASSWWFYTEDLDWGDSPGFGPNLEGIAFDDAGAFLRAVHPDDYSETQFLLGDGGNSWGLHFNPTTDFIQLDGTAAVPEPSTVVLLALGLAGVLCVRRRSAR